MTVEMWMGLGIIVAIVGFVLWKTALNLRAKRQQKCRNV